MAETKRDRVKDILCSYLVENADMNIDDAYEGACDLADEIFESLVVSAVEQDRP